LSGFNLENYNAQPFNRLLSGMIVLHLVAAPMMNFGLGDAQIVGVLAALPYDGAFRQVHRVA
jgi:hypothetical protein